MSMQKRSVRIQDPPLRDAAGRLEWFTRMVHKRLDEYKAASDRVEMGLALAEAEVAAKLVQAATYEVALRLVPHGIAFDPAAQLGKRLRIYRQCAAEFELTYGPMAEA